MKTVWKYSIEEHVTYNTINVPYGAKPLRIEYQPDGWKMWFLCSPNLPYNQMRRFRNAYTGEEIHDRILAYVDTMFLDNGIVIHVFEVEIEE